MTTVLPAALALAALCACGCARAPSPSLGTTSTPTSTGTSTPTATSTAMSTATSTAMSTATSSPSPSPTSMASPAVNEGVATDAPSDASREGPDGMHLVPAGPFTMGADREGQQDERPAHTVTIGAFWLDATEVTNEAYARCVAAGPCRAPDPRGADLNKLGPDAKFRGPRQPVSSISWHDARAYCAWAGKRLPTEAEWEKAARGADGRRFPWGDEPPARERAVFASGVTEDVGTHPKGDGPYGHHDLAGNVWEWVEDVYDPYAYRRPGAAEGKGGTCADAMAAQDDLRRQGRQGFTGTNPIPTECERVLRGGAMNYDGPGLRASNRVHHAPAMHLVMSGFRCARDAAGGGAR